MTDITEQIANIQKEIRETPYHKGTEHHIGMLRARIARLKDKVIDSESKKGGGGGGGYAVKKQGDATIVLVGPPSVGKSTLINSLTNANSKIAPYAFTTVTVIPGMMEYQNARIQILDVPGLIEGAEEGKGRGREVISVIRGCDLLLLISEPGKEKAFDSILAALERNGIRVNKQKPNIHVIKKIDGGINIYSNLNQELSKDTIKAVANEMGIKNADIKIKQKVSVDDLIDVFSKNRVYTQALFVLNKSEQQRKIAKENYMYISAQTGKGVDLLLEEVWKRLDFINVYLVKRDEEPSNNAPIVVKKNITLKEISEKIGEGFAEKIDHAVIWGQGSKFAGQEVSLNTKAVNGMQVRFVN